MNTKMLKFSLLTLLDEFTCLISKCLKFDTFPATWKIALVVPIPKGVNILSDWQKLNSSTFNEAGGMLLHALHSFGRIATAFGIAVTIVNPQSTGE